MLEQGHLTLSPGGWLEHHHHHHHHYFLATWLKEEIFNMSASLGNASLAQVVCRRTANPHKSFVPCFAFQVRPCVGRGRAAASGSH